MSFAGFPRIAARVAMLLAVSPALLSSAPSRAQPPSQDIEIASGIICDTRRQIERFVALMDEGLDTAVKLVNVEENNPNACGFAVMAFSRGAELGTVRTKNNAYNILEITVVGIRTSLGFQRVTPTSFFSLEKVEEIAV